MNFITISTQLLFLSFILLLLSLIPLGFVVRNKTPRMLFLAHSFIYSTIICQLLFIMTRWIGVGHAPVSNMYEFMTFFGIIFLLVSLFIYQHYKQIAILLFSATIAIIIIGYGATFSHDASPLIPALQSHWLAVHVITVALSSAILSISFITSLLCLLQKIDRNKHPKAHIALECILFQLVVVIGYIINQLVVARFITPTILAYDNSGLFHAPQWLDIHKANTLLLAYGTGFLLYIGLRIIGKKTIVGILQPFTVTLSPQTLDDITYQAILIGFPLFSLGGLVFAMIWAQQAWGRFWGWDPKEVWALITWLFYAGLLHFRFVKEADEEKTAWLAIIGFALIIFNQVFVNLIIAGLHSYA